ncbi:MAG: universal stress protein [Armatimonadetes bacterium]|nr:universal stress protein [Armatimonadota bacterium]
MDFHSNKILVPVELDDAPPRLLDDAARLARKLGSKLIVLHVIDIRPLVADFAVIPPIEELHAFANETLQSWCDKLDDLKTDVVILHGNVVEEILDYADTVDADLIMMSTHGRRGVERLVLGSTAERVVRHSQRPVLTLRMMPARVTA